LRSDYVGITNCWTNPEGWQKVANT
jgi:hypothetical protein